MSELSGGKSLFKNCIYMSSKRLCVVKSLYFRSVEGDIIFVCETESFQK